MKDNSGVQQGDVGVDFGNMVLVQMGQTLQGAPVLELDALNRELKRNHVQLMSELANQLQYLSDIRAAIHQIADSVNIAQSHMDQSIALMEGRIIEKIHNERWITRLKSWLRRLFGR